MRTGGRGRDRGEVGSGGRRGGVRGRRRGRALRAGQQERATALVSDEFAAVRAAGRRSAFYDRCVVPTAPPNLFGAWLGREAKIVQIGRELTAIEQ